MPKGRRLIRLRPAVLTRPGPGLQGLTPIQDDTVPALEPTVDGWVDQWPSGHRSGPWTDEELAILEELDGR